MEFETLAKAVASIPHVGQLLSVTLTIGVGIYEELKNLDSTLAAEKELGEEANYIIRDIALYSKNLKASDQVHLERLAKQLKNVEEVSRRIRNHIWCASCARERHVRKYGRKLAELYESAIESAVVLNLKEQLREAKTSLMGEFQWIKMMEGDRAGMEQQTYTGLHETERQGRYSESKASEPVRWVKREELDDKLDIYKMMVPVCRREDSEDGALWYIARVPYIGGRQPGKYKPGDSAYFGFNREALPATNLDFEVLVAPPGTVRWQTMFGRFSEERLRPARPVKGCYENDGTELVIARAWAREHMRTGIFTEKTLQPGKASPKLDHAYVTAGKKEKKVEVYEVLVYA